MFGQHSDLEIKKQSKVNDFMKQMEKRMQTECTFRPKINSTSVNSTSRLSDNPLLRREHLIKKDTEKYTFRPAINKQVCPSSPDFEDAYERLYSKNKIPTDFKSKLTNLR